MRVIRHKRYAYMYSVFFCLLFFLSSCSGAQETKQKNTSYAYICLEHGTHYYNDPASLSKCLGISPQKFTDYYFFHNDGTTKDKDNLVQLRYMLKEKLADQLVTVIINRLQIAFGEEVTTRWHLESTTLPVLFRHFTQFDGKLYHVKVIAVIAKKDLAPRSLIRFLPLEYKMNFMQPSEEELRLMLP
jgi:hypothetical protein